MSGGSVTINTTLHLDVETPILVEEVFGPETFPVVRLGSMQQFVTIITDLEGIRRLRDALDLYVREHDPILAQEPDPNPMPETSDEALLLVPGDPADNDKEPWL